jgi:hypothetical protein
LPLLLLWRMLHLVLLLLQVRSWPCMRPMVPSVLLLLLRGVVRRPMLLLLLLLQGLALWPVRPRSSRVSVVLRVPCVWHHWEGHPWVVRGHSIHATVLGIPHHHRLSRRGHAVATRCCCCSCCGLCCCCCLGCHAWYRHCWNRWHTPSSTHLLRLLLVPTHPLLRPIAGRTPSVHIRT